MKYVTDHLTQKNTERVNFQRKKKYVGLLPSCILRVPPPPSPPGGNGRFQIYSYFGKRRETKTLKAGVRLKPVFPPRNLGLMRISRSRFKHSQNPLFIPQSYVQRCFVNFLVIFGDFWKGISKIWRNKKYKKFNVIFKLEFEAKN